MKSFAILFLISLLSFAKESPMDMALKEDGITRITCLNTDLKRVKKPGPYSYDLYLPKN
ncbi:MAG: hypothetical protein HRT89_07330, partial [Lentisphaeria bacterium]|nr:hypothetical protein [Lentisphaeria bacterium]